MIENIVRDLVVAPVTVFTVVSMGAYLECLSQSYKIEPHMGRKARLQLTQDMFRQFYFDQKGYLIPLAFTSPFYIKFIAENIIR
ncbi:hypothetical protein JXB28_06285 [Candidatus Woesearchaeota archaeon]|nr:hypothetical protein [Candidatus Woesearchaeota archaeon]